MGLFLVGPWAGKGEEAVSAFQREIEALARSQQSSEVHGSVILMMALRLTQM